jgi:protein-S-isoprenylcysteine O-methyltransferase Ste14
VALLVIVALGHFVPMASLPPQGSHVLAIVTAALGVFFILGAAFQFRTSQTTLDPRVPDQAAKLVSNGIYRVTRNPMYLGMALLLLAAACWCAPLPGLAVVAAFCAYITRFQIKPEERAMRQRFGAEYEAYMSRVRRWI